MKKKLFTKARIIGATFILLSIGLVTGIAATVDTGSGCPGDTGGYKSNGTRNDKPCQHSVVETGFWWYIEGEVKWVGTVFASMGGSVQKGTKTTTVKGIEYRCDGFGDEACWVCNCYSLAANTAIKE